MTSREVRESIIKQITDMLDEWKTDKEIMEQLNLNRTTYHRYKSRIKKLDNKILEQTRSDEMGHRILQVRKSLEFCIKVNKDICERSLDDKARIEASAMIVKAQMGLLNLTTNPHYSEQVKIIHR